MLALTLAAFLPSLRGSFVWDDVALIERNPAMRSGTGFVEIATRDLWGQATGATTQLYHPLPMLSIWAQTQLFGVELVPLRLFNVALHLLCVWCFVQLLLRLAVPSRWSWLAGLVVAVHPSVCEPVMWITGRHDTLGMLLLMAAMLSWTEPGGRRAVLRALASGLCLALAFLSKEPYVVGLALLGLWMGARAVQAGVPLRARDVRLLALAGLPVALVWVLRRSLGISAGSAQLHAGVLVHAHSFASVVWHYALQLLSFGNGLTIAPFVQLSPMAAVGVWLVVLALAAGLGRAAWRSTERDPHAVVALLGFLWFLVALTPHVISVPSIGLYGNRYAYCALFGLVLCGVSVLARLRFPSARSASWVQAGAVVLGIACAWKTSVAASAWRDNRTLYLADVMRAPDNGPAYYHLGTAVLSAEGCSAALPLFVRATQLAPRYERAFHNAAGCLINLGKPAEALPFAKRAVQLSPFDPRARHNLALSELARGRTRAAREQLQIALRLDPHHAQAEQTLRLLDAQTAKQP